MTTPNDRQRQAEEAAYEYADKNYIYVEDDDVSQSGGFKDFIAGVQWADENPVETKLPGQRFDWDTLHTCHDECKNPKCADSTPPPPAKGKRK